MKNNAIKPEEHLAAAKFFTMSNMCLLHLVPPNAQDNIDYAYSYVDGILEQETGENSKEEYLSWLKLIKKAKPTDYVATEWAKQRTNWGFKN